MRRALRHSRGPSRHKPEGGRHCGNDCAAAAPGGVAGARFPDVICSDHCSGSGIWLHAGRACQLWAKMDATCDRRAAGLRYFRACNGAHWCRSFQCRLALWPDCQLTFCACYGHRRGSGRSSGGGSCVLWARLAGIMDHGRWAALDPRGRSLRRRTGWCALLRAGTGGSCSAHAHPWVFVGHSLAGARAIRWRCPDRSIFCALGRNAKACGSHRREWRARRGDDR